MTMGMRDSLGSKRGNGETMQNRADFRTTGSFTKTINKGRRMLSGRRQIEDDIRVLVPSAVS